MTARDLCVRLAAIFAGALVLASCQTSSTATQEIGKPSTIYSRPAPKASAIEKTELAPIAGTKVRSASTNTEFSGVATTSTNSPTATDGLPSLCDDSDPLAPSTNCPDNTQLTTSPQPAQLPSLSTN